MAEYDGLPLNTPTKIREDDNFEIWATRTQNGGTVENRIKANSDADRARSIEQKIRDAIATNKTFLALANPSNAQTLAQVKALTRQNNNIIRKLAGLSDEVD
jgi:hypothetical protein